MRAINIKKAPTKKTIRVIVVSFKYICLILYYFATYIIFYFYFESNFECFSICYFFFSPSDLSISFESHGAVKVVDGVSFEVRPGQCMALVGESGCGKSITTKVIMGLTDPKESITGTVLYKGQDLLKISKDEHRRLLGHELAMVYQDALSSLNPSMLISSQMKQLTSRGGTRSAEELLELVGLDPKRTLESYPHELSGGQRQRVLIAMALTRDPSLVICDEPTTALDVTVQKQVIKLLNDLQDRLGFAMIFVSHDKTQAILQVIQELDDLLLNGNIQRRRRFVADNK